MPKDAHIANDRQAQLLHDIQQQMSYAIEGEVDGSTLRRPKTDPYLECTTTAGERFELRIHAIRNPDGP